MHDKLLYGKNDTQKIVSIEVGDSNIEIFTENKNGEVKSFIKPFKHWFLSSVKLSKNCTKLKGNLHYSFLHEYETLEEYEYASKLVWYKKKDSNQIYNVKERAMLRSGMTYFKGMKHNEISVLSFDIETTGLKHNKDSFLIIISNTLKKGEKTIKKMFCYDEYESQGEMIKDWCKWVREVNPSVICGHNIFCYDIPYLKYIADRAGVTLDLGRDGSTMYYSKKGRKFRKDSSMLIEYLPAFIYGREIIDTLFLSYKYDVSNRKYINYRLKNIISQEGLEKPDRQFYDASKIRFNYKDPIELSKIKKYAYDDADDSLALYKLMSPPFFYLTQSIPKPFQEIVCSASGSQVNSVMMRAYLQEDWSIPKKSEKTQYQGAISLGMPGIYRNVFKVDVASLYPSIMIWGEVYDENKDPNAYFLKIVKAFTKMRLEHKKLGKTNQYYKDMSAAEKIFINSCYGFLGSGTSNFNCPAGAAYITELGRDVFVKAVKWATDGTLKSVKNVKKGESKFKIYNTNPNKFTLVNGDTDSISFCKPDFSEIISEERKELLEDLNSLYPEQINWEDDGYYSTCIVVKAKNYVMHDKNEKNPTKQLKYKGSAIKATTKEKALQQFIKDIIDAILNKTNNYKEIYESYVKEIIDMPDINRWASKKTITEKVLNPKQTAQEKIFEAIQGKDYSEGDKFYFFFKSDNSLCLVEDYDGDYNVVKLLKKLYDTAIVFKSILPIEKLFIKYYIKKNQQLLQNLLTSDIDNDIITVGVVK